MTKEAALKVVSRLALERAEETGVTTSTGAAEFYDAMAAALDGACPEEYVEARLLAALAREGERHQLKFRELLKS